MVSAAIWANPVHLRYKSSDLAFPTVANPSATPTSPVTQSGEAASGLPSGAKIGIGVSLPITALITILLVLLYRRGRARQVADNVPGVERTLADKVPNSILPGPVWPPSKEGTGSVTAELEAR
ncbi:hypothetical protein EJ08DRAFT_691264 [Tothia fuscella]|uniref:Uncharacterized protein n=1 Tax=Tothia fuscella TaxID=1048955 RepID=A0A9P4U4G2_9PEZI|nr:hypothetical protein EJ08DRAFT_691264 [Tothia fuscella]